MARCMLCSQDFERSSRGAGRLRQYCSDRCRASARREAAKRRRAASLAVARYCRACGAGFVPTSGQHHFCLDPACRSERATANQRRYGRRPRAAYLASVARPVRACRHCAAAFRPTRSDVTTYCSRACAFAARREAASPKFTSVHPCKVCGKWGRRTTCGLACERAHDAARARARALRRHSPAMKVCKGCGVQFTTVYGHSSAKYCDAKCATRNIRAAQKTRLRGARVPNIVVGRIAVFERDGWRCHWCHAPTPRELIGSTSPSAPELDHVIPVSRGGKHIHDNVVCACRACNSKKSDAMPAEFLRRMIAEIDAHIRAHEVLLLTDAAR